MLSNDIKQRIFSNDLSEYPTERLHGYIAHIITLPNNRISINGAMRLIQSIKDTNSFIDPQIIVASTPETVTEDLAKYGLTENDWTWPKNPGEQKLDIKSGLKLHGYGAKDWRKVLACLVSHMKSWHYCAQFNVPVIVFEHDAVVTKTISKTYLELLIKQVQDSFVDANDHIGIIGLNDPRGATRKANVYLEKVIEESSPTSLKVTAPWIDDRTIPQGIAGNSAYIIGPKAARRLFVLIGEHGLWPNDALMCKQLLGPMLYQAYPFHTGLQGISSTTQG